MLRVERYRTADGIEHRTETDARKHLDKVYGEKLTGLAHELVAQADGKYGRTAEFLDANLARFVELASLRNDQNLENPEDTDS